jgi:hypothetical protein
MQGSDGHAGQFGHASHGQVFFHAPDYAASREVRVNRLATVVC